MHRILVSECKQEVSSFNPVIGSYEDFSISRGQELIDHHRATGTEMAGALSVFAGDSGIKVAPGYSARGITSGGTLGDSGFSRIALEFLDSVRAARPVDGVYFSLHGALAAESEPDVEGRLLAETRKILGEKIPVVISLDLHGVLTDRMLAHCDAATVYQTYPHVDFFETGQRAARLLLRLLSGEIHPVMARVSIPALVRGDELITETGLFGQIVRKAQAVETSGSGLSAGMFIGNPFTDVPDLCSNAFVVTDGDSDGARRVAVELAQEFWQARHRLQSKLTGLDESVRLAADAKGRVILKDAADATSSGASGDSNAILRALLRAQFQRKTLIPIVDPPAAKVASEAGPGKIVQVTLGGALDPVRFKPLPLECRIVTTSDGKFRSESHGEEWRAGATAVLQAANYTVVVTTHPVSLYDRSLFLAHGLDPAQFDAVIVKSPHCQPRFFDEGAELILNVDAPGATSANLKSLGHKNCRRPIFPLDSDFGWTPEPHLFDGSHGASHENP
ncbi:MAG TPA: M81 family metallopeptidase [Terriglobia bacterium]|nr:M81 family metallopeptidase [Terriglobia bacterium]